MNTPPRLVAKTLAVTFVTVAVILSVVFTVLLVDARDRVRGAEVEKLTASERIFNRFEAQRQRDQLAAVAALAENQVLISSLAGYIGEPTSTTSAAAKAEIYGTLAAEVDRLALVTAADVVAVVDTNGRIIASAGRSGERWPIGESAIVPSGGTALPTTRLPGVTPADAAHPSVALPSVAILHDRPFRLSSAQLRTRAGDIGTLVIATTLDSQYASALSALAGAGIVIAMNGRVVGNTVSDTVARSLLAFGDEVGDSRNLNGDEYAVRTLLSSGPARIYMLASIDRAAQAAMRDALAALAMVALWAFVLAAVASLWLARTFTGPINHVAGTIATMTASRDFSRTLPRSGSSREVDALANSFNDLMGGLMAAEAETRAAYLGTIRALAVALDARDPYTAGHSERVSTTAVVIARHLQLREADVAIIRLGALLHDIGKIGLADEVLQKPSALTPEEFEHIKRHPSLGAKILRQVSFLQPHLPIVELHHERPDGGGYPYGLRGEEIPLAARIVHVADAFDAITTARAYRPARPVAAALDELRQFAGTQFDAASVNALCEAQGARAHDHERPQEPAALGA